MKNFNGKHKNEKVLYFSKENIISYIVRNFNFIFIILGGLLFLAFFLYFMELNSMIFFVIILLYILISIFFFGFFWYKTFFIVTNKRLLKYVRNGLFSEHIKELKIDQINELISSKAGIIVKLFGYGNIKITGKGEENVIRVRGIYHPNEVIQYVSRLRDYCFENTGYDCKTLNVFKLRKDRKN